VSEPDDLELDHVGWIVEQWRRQRPDLDPSPQGIIGRLHRLGARLTEELAAVYGQYGLGPGEFDILATLRRAGEPYSLTPKELTTQTMVSSGAVTKRVDRCVEQGWVTRRVADADARGRVIALTDAGRELIDAAFTAHIANEHRLVELIPAADRAELARILEAWGRAL